MFSKIFPSLGHIFRDFYHFLSGHKESLKQLIDQKNEKLLELMRSLQNASQTLLAFALRINFDLLSSCGLCCVFIDHFLLGQNIESIEKNFLPVTEIQSPVSGQKREFVNETLDLYRLSIVQAIFILIPEAKQLEECKCLGKSYLNFALSECEKTQPMIKHFGFKTLKALTYNFTLGDNNPQRKEFFELESKHFQLLEVLLKNWEFPVRYIILFFPYNLMSLHAIIK